MFDTAIGVGGFAASVFGAVAGLHQGKQINRILEGQNSLNLRIEKLESGLYYTPDIQTIRLLEHSQQKAIEEIKNIKELLLPIKRALGADVLATSATIAPRAVSENFLRNAKEYLMYVQPIAGEKPSVGDGMVPLVFNDNEGIKIGWQKHAIMSKIFNIDIAPLDINNNFTRMTSDAIEAQAGGGNKIENLDTDRQGLERDEFNIIYKLKCKANRNSAGYYDSPPREVTKPYPYTFKITRSAMCYLIVNMDVWVKTNGLINIVTTRINERQVAQTTANWNYSKNNFFQKTTLGLLDPGFYHITFETKWEDDGFTELTEQNLIGTANNYWMLRGVEVIEHL